MENLQYPVGRFKLEEEPGMAQINLSIGVIKKLPEKLTEAVKGLNDEQLNPRYREGGWTIRQVVHHLADSHMNALIRFKLALTESNPVIKPYFEDKWAELEDYRTVPIEVSLKLIEALHERWVTLMESMTLQDFNRTYFHPENNRQYLLAEVVALYDWHSRHHLAHITSLKERMKW